MPNLICGFCKRPFYEQDLYSHAMANHQNAVEMLSREAEEMAQKAWVLNHTNLCGLKIGGEPCGKPAIAIAGCRIHTIDRKTRLSNPTRGEDIVFCSYQKMCEPHCLEVTPDDLVQMLSGWDQIEHAAGLRGLMLDRLFRDPQTGHIGPDPIFWPIQQPVMQ